jgi:hypothetical protein
MIVTEGREGYEFAAETHTPGCPEWFYATYSHSGPSFLKTPEQPQPHCSAELCSVYSFNLHRHCEGNS